MRALRSGLRDLSGSSSERWRGSNRRGEHGRGGLTINLSLYERGAELKKRCEAKLKEAEQKVAAITLDEDGSVTGTKPLEGL